MSLLGLHHVAIICSDYPRSRDFYVRILGLRVLNEVYRAERQSHKLDLALPDGTQIELFSFPNPPPRPSYPEARGLRHLAFRVADLDSEVARLTALGVAVEPIRVDEHAAGGAQAEGTRAGASGAHAGRRYTFFADPDGLPLELYEEA